MTRYLFERKLFGILTGIALILAWSAFVLFISEHQLFPGPAYAGSPLLAWIFLGPVPLFIGIGMYYFMRSSWSDAKKHQQSAAIKAGVLGFFLWIAMIILFPAIGNLSSVFITLPVLAGYVLMFVLMIFFWRMKGGVLSVT